MDKLAAKHRFTLAIIFTFLGLAIPVAILFIGIKESNLALSVAGSFVEGVVAAILKDIYQFYFRKASDAEKKGGKNDS